MADKLTQEEIYALVDAKKYDEVLPHLNDDCVLRDLDLYMQLVRCYVGKNDRENAKIAATYIVTCDLEKATRPNTVPPFANVMLNYILYEGSFVGYLHDSLEVYKQFLDTYGKYDICSDGYNLYQCYKAMWINEVALYPLYGNTPSKEHVKLLEDCLDSTFLASLHRGHEDLIESLQKMLDYSKTV